MSKQEAFVISPDFMWSRYGDYVFIAPDDREIFVKANEGDLYENQVVVLELTDERVVGASEYFYWRLVT